jgi:hypothetical protein
MNHTSLVARRNFRLRFGIGNSGLKRQNRRPCKRSRSTRSSALRWMRGSARVFSRRSSKQWGNSLLVSEVSFHKQYHNLRLLTPSQHEVPHPIPWRMLPKVRPQILYSSSFPSRPFSTLLPPPPLKHASVLRFRDFTSHLHAHSFLLLIPSLNP